MATKEEVYDVDNMISLTPLEHIRKRVTMYLGSLSRSKNVALREPIDNSIDEYRTGHGKKIKIIIHEDGSAEIQDSGRGVPTGIHSKTGENGIFMAFGKVGSGGKFGAADSGYGNTSALGLNGVGTTATNATSLRFDCIVYNKGKKHELDFKHGIPGHFQGDGPDAKFVEKNVIKVSKDDRTATEKKERR